MGKLADNHGYGDAHSADTGAAAEDLGIKRYSFKHGACLSKGLALTPHIFYCTAQAEPQNYLL